MDKILGRVMTVAGSQMTVKLDADYRDQCSIGIGAMVKVCRADRQVVAAGCAVQYENSSLPERLLVAPRPSRSAGRRAVPSTNCPTC